jgi:Zn-finger nucleic acid-binding protein
MKCPRCAETELVVSHRQGVEIDSCPRCRGVWLDRGELDKLIERSTAIEAAAANSTAAWLQPEQARSDVDGDRRTNGSRKHSWLSHIFD